MSDHFIFCYRISNPFLKILKTHGEIDEKPLKNDTKKKKMKLNKKFKLFFFASNLFSVKILSFGKIRFRKYYICSEIGIDTNIIRKFSFSNIVRQFLSEFSIYFLKRFSALKFQLTATE